MANRHKARTAQKRYQRAQANRYSSYKTGNFAMYSAMAGLRASGAARSHDSRPRRQRTRHAAKQAEIALSH